MSRNREDRPESGQSRRRYQQWSHPVTFFHSVTLKQNKEP
ncbi:Uncharacterised protein [Vibrio cholerae]|nr:Uncharacterised protein [Vibrio cholerae]